MRSSVRSMGIFFLFLAIAFTAVRSGYGWYWSQSTDVGEQVWAVAALDSRNIAAGTHSGKVYIPRAGGRWFVGPICPTRSRSMDASDENHVWIGTGGGRSIFLTDPPLPSRPPFLPDIPFPPLPPLTPTMSGRPMSGIFIL